MAVSWGASLCLPRRNRRADRARQRAIFRRPWGAAGLSGSVLLNERNFDVPRPRVGLEDLLDGRAFRGAGQELRIEAVPGTQLPRYGVIFRDR
jgi:hypothetical protein